VDTQLNIKRFRSLGKFLVYILFDVGAIAFSLYFSLLLRFEGAIDPYFVNIALRYGAWIILAGAAIFFMFGFYRQIWRFASAEQYLLIVFGTVSHLIVIMVPMLYARQRLPWSVYLLMLFLETGIIGGSRLLLREYFRFNRTRGKSLLPGGRPDEKGTRILIYGAGQAGFQMLRDLQEHPRGKTAVVLIDDNPEMWRRFVLGIQVYGGRDKLVEAAEKFEIDQILIAMPSVHGTNLKHILEIAEQTQCEIKILPDLNDLIDGKVTYQDVRDIDINDLLGRDVVELDMESIRHVISGQTVLVTGGGGSIGSEICRQVARYQPRSLVIFDIYENNAYELEQELLAKYPDQLDVKVLIGSIRDPGRLQEVFTACQPSIVFHAAAHKHVPLMENSPAEAVKNNVRGTYNVAKAAGQNNVQRFVLISTDKAVNPTNVMGATKRLAEMTVQNLQSLYPQTIYAIVRFGNVLGSNGSVIPLFKHQIKTQKRVTITHPDITRFFMTIPEAAKLVLQAGSMSEGGETFILDMGEPVKILDMARKMIILSGYQPDKDIKIVYTGLRPGEKMYEELFLDHEQIVATRHKKIRKLLRDQTTDLTPEIRHLLDVIHIGDQSFSDIMSDSTAESPVFYLDHTDSARD
jgi:FlaA1/EpsC-like NDP-sugar epimerase